MHQKLYFKKARMTAKIFSKSTYEGKFGDWTRKVFKNRLFENKKILTQYDTFAKCEIVNFCDRQKMGVS